MHDFNLGPSAPLKRNQRPHAGAPVAKAPWGRRQVDRRYQPCFCVSKRCAGTFRIVKTVRDHRALDEALLERQRHIISLSHVADLAAPRPHGIPVHLEPAAMPIDIISCVSLSKPMCPNTHLAMQSTLRMGVTLIWKMTRLHLLRVSILQPQSLTMESTLYHERFAFARTSYMIGC